MLEQGIPERKVRQQEEGRVLYALGQAEALLRQLALLSATPPARDKTHTVPTAPGRVEAFLPVADTALAPGRRLFSTAGAPQPLVTISGVPRGNLQREFLLDTFRGIRQGFE